MTLAFFTLTSVFVGFVSIGLFLYVTIHNNDSGAEFVDNLLSKAPTLLIFSWLPNISVFYNNLLIYPTAKHLNNFNKNYVVEGLDNWQAVWIVEAENRQLDDPVIIYLHGGAYAMGFLPPFSFFLNNLYHQVENDRLSIIVLDYSLTDKATYPTQLKELSLLYNSLSNTSENIWLLGDSAGGHLSLHLTRHYEYPVPGVPKIVRKPTGLILLSPWVNITPDKKTDGASFVTKSGRDYMTAEFLEDAGKVYLNYNSELHDDPSINFYIDYDSNWSSLLPVSSNVFVTLGDDEVLRDDILAWTKIAELPESSIFNQIGGVHDTGPILTGLNGIFPKVVDYLRKTL